MFRVLNPAVGGTQGVVFFAAANRDQLIDASRPCSARRASKDSAHLLAHVQSVKPSEYRRISYESDRGDRFVPTKLEIVVRDHDNFPNEYARFVIRNACGESKQEDGDDDSHDVLRASLARMVRGCKGGIRVQLTLSMAILVNKPRRHVGRNFRFGS
jgi:hypothetical protein